jgi:hypothetical protein
MLEISKSTNNIGLTFSSKNPNIYNQFKKDQDGEVFEKVVFDLMLNKYSNDTELTEYILSLPNDKQRMALLALIDGDTALWSKMNSYVNECSDKFEHIKDVIKIMAKFVKDGEVERKKFGEVMTPISLVREMLNTLPKEVWSNPDLKWLDPCNGAGTFPYVIIYMLMNGLSEWEPDTEKRYKHIVENMIYTCELQSRNVFLWLCGVDPKNEYTTNSYWGSFLDDGFDYHMKNVWNVSNFDVIIGNPPYQEQKEGNKKTKPLWNLFVLKSLNIISNEGYLTLIHPSGWRSPAGIFRDIYNKFMEKNILYLSLNDFKKGFEVFGVGTNFDFYTLQNTKNKNIETRIKTTDDEEILIRLNDFSFIPNGDFELYKRIMAFGNEEKVNTLHSYSAYETRKTYISKEKTETNIYPCVYTITQNAGINFYWSKNKNNGHFDIPKLIWSNGLGTYPIIDKSGDYGMTQFSYAIIDDLDILLKIKEVLESKRFLDMINYSKFTNNKYDFKVISNFKKDFWKYFITK